MKNDPLVSVIIPAFKAAPFIKECLDAVLKQSYENYEIIVVDDGSPDNQKDIIQPYLDNNKNIKYYYQPNKGVSAARNSGFKISKGDLVAFLDADDVWMPNNLEVKVHAIQKDNIGMVHSNAYLIDEHSNLIEGELSGSEGQLLNKLLAWKDTVVPGPSSILIKRKVVENIGLWDEELSTSADQDFFIRVASKYPVGKVFLNTWKYRIHPHNMHKNIELMEKDVLYIFSKAKKNKLFSNKNFERACFANMYMILASSWAGDGKNLKRGAYFLIKSLLVHPQSILVVIKKVIGKLIINHGS